MPWFVYPRQGSEPTCATSATTTNNNGRAPVFHNALTKTHREAQRSAHTPGLVRFAARFWLNRSQTVVRLFRGGGALNRATCADTAGKAGCSFFEPCARRFVVVPASRLRICVARCLKSTTLNGHVAAKALVFRLRCARLGVGETKGAQLKKLHVMLFSFAGFANKNQAFLYRCLQNLLSEKNLPRRTF